MKVIKVIKHYRNGTVEDYLILDDWQYSTPEEEKSWIEEWAEQNVAGQNYGYRVEYDDETEPIVIGEVLRKELDLIDNKIENLHTTRNKIREFLIIYIKWERKIKC